MQRHTTGMPAIQAAATARPFATGAGLGTRTALTVVLWSVCMKGPAVLTFGAFDTDTLRLLLRRHIVAYFDNGRQPAGEIEGSVRLNGGAILESS
jgi:hypothetical protein